MTNHKMNKYYILFISNALMDFVSLTDVKGKQIPNAVFKIDTNGPPQRFQFGIADVIPFVIEWSVFYELNPFLFIGMFAFDQLY